jgi:adenylate kinase
MFNILLLGPQGAGKGTQAERLSAVLGIPMISVGRLFRDEIDRGTGLGQAIADYVERGDRVPPDITDQIISARIMEDDTVNGMILDGYPRTSDQIETLNKILKKADRQLTHVIVLRIPDELATWRLSGRRVCSNLKCETNFHVEANPPKIDPNRCDKCGSPLVQRSDDFPEAIKRRLELYHRDTEPVIDYFRKQGLLHEIDGSRGINEVAASVAEIFA